MARPKFDIIAGDFALTQEAAGVLAGVSVQTLKKWEKQDNPPPRMSDGTYSAKLFGVWLSTSRGDKKAGAPAHTGSANKNDAEARLKEAQAIRAERENDVAEGLLVPSDMVETGWQDILMRVRSRLLRIPTAMATSLVGDMDINSIQDKLKDGVHEALSELSENWKDGIDDEAT